MWTEWLNAQFYADLHTPETGNHQDQVKVLIEKTASALDDMALKMLFVSVQQNNIDVCIQYAIQWYVMFPLSMDLTMTFFSLMDKIGDISTVRLRHCNPNDCIRLNLIQEEMTWRTMIWFGHSYVSDSE